MDPVPVGHIGDEAAREVLFAKPHWPQTDGERDGELGAYCCNDGPHSCSVAVGADMERIRILLSRCAALFRQRALDEDLEEELRSHVDFAIAERIEHGMPEAEARHAALKEFGGVT